jgi:hypothetical protein
MKRIAMLAAALLTCTGGLAVAAPANAEITPVPEVAYALAQVPGGQLIDERTAYWPHLTMTLNVPNPLLRDAIGSCPNNSICAFSGPTLTGSRLSWAVCSNYSTTALATVQSIADARSTGKLQARYGTTVRATALAQSWTNVTGTVNNVNCL